MQGRPPSAATASASKVKDKAQGASKATPGTSTAAAAAATNQLQHSEKLRDSLHGCVSAYLNIPELVQRDVVKELGSISRTTVGKEKAILAIDQALHKLPRQLGQLEEVVASISVKASSRITLPTARLEAATSGTPLLLLRAPSLQPEPLPLSLAPRDGLSRQSSGSVV